jgi:phenylacetate-coenzyme A ligase PaaK-like adenylate-forming protein
LFNHQSLKKVSHLIQFFSAGKGRERISLSSWDDFQRVPFSQRKDLKKFLKTNSLQHVFNVTATSGSTSSRMLIAHSREAYDAHVHRLAKLYQLVGIKKGTVCLNLCSYELNSGGRLMETALKKSGAGVIPLGPISTPEKVQEAATLVKLLKPRWVNAYTNQLYDLLNVLGRRHSLKHCLVNGEPLWSTYQRRMEKMGGVEVHNHYGAMEISGLAVALRSKDSHMRVVADGLLLEVLQDNGEVARVGTGALVVTDLNNTSMPFIRYGLGDRVELTHRQGALWIKVLGRIEESVLINGVVMTKEDLVRVVNDLLGHPRFFFILDKHPLKYYDKLLLNVLDGIPQQFEALSTAIVKTLGIDSCIEIRRHQGAIPRTINGKIRYFLDIRKQKENI